MSAFEIKSLEERIALLEDTIRILVRANKLYPLDDPKRALVFAIANGLVTPTIYSQNQLCLPIKEPINGKG